MVLAGPVVTFGNESEQADQPLVELLRLKKYNLQTANLVDPVSAECVTLVMCALGGPATSLGLPQLFREILLLARD